MGVMGWEMESRLPLNTDGRQPLELAMEPQTQLKSRVCRHMAHLGPPQPGEWRYCDECWNLYIRTRTPRIFQHAIESEQKRQRLEAQREEREEERERERLREQVLPQTLRWRLRYWADDGEEKPYWENILTGDWQWERPEPPEEAALCGRARCGHRPPPGSRFCNACGGRLLAGAAASGGPPEAAASSAASAQPSSPSSSGSASSSSSADERPKVPQQQDGCEEADDPLELVGFRIGSSVLHTSAAEWAVFREQVQSQRESGVKHEIATVDSKDVYFTQRSCSNVLRNGKPVSELAQEIRDGWVDPLEDDWLILDVVQAFVRPNRKWGTPRRSVYFTLSHRRLKAMRDAGCEKVRVHILMSGSHALNAFLSKAMESLGLREDIKVKPLGTGSS